MPVMWAQPVPPLNFVSKTVSSFTTATKTDISPAQVVIYPGQLAPGTRIRITAFGNMISTTTASSIVWGFYMNSTATNNIATTPAIIAETASTAIVNTSSVAWPWWLSWTGHVRALTAPIIGATNGQLFGEGQAYVPLTLTTQTQTAMPITAALRTVQETATGMVTNIPQTVMMGVTVAVNTGLTSVTCDELTCELLG